MSNFMTLCEESVVDFETRVEQPIGTMEVLVPESVDVSIWEFHALNKHIFFFFFLFFFFFDGRRVSISQNEESPTPQERRHSRMTSCTEGVCPSEPVGAWSNKDKTKDVAAAQLRTLDQRLCHARAASS